MLQLLLISTQLQMFQIARWKINGRSVFSVLFFYCINKEVPNTETGKDLNLMLQFLFFSFLSDVIFLGV